MVREPRPLPFPKRGEIYLVALDPASGSEIRKTRPAVIVQNDIANASSPVTIVAAITSRVTESFYPTEVPIKPGESGLMVDSLVLCNQLRTIDKGRILKRMGRLHPDKLNAVDRALKFSLGLLPLQ
jgi:mRNA interferase MazF